MNLWAEETTTTRRGHNDKAIFAARLGAFGVLTQPREVLYSFTNHIKSLFKIILLLLTQKMHR